MGKVFTKVELARKIKDAGYIDSFIETEAVSNEDLITGNLHFVSLPSGLNIHSADVMENSNGHSTSKVDAAISINILFNGKVSYALSNERFDLHAKVNPLLFISVLNSEHIFTRYFVKHNEIKKLNISVDRTWLLARCSNEQQRDEIENLFSNRQSVYQWQCSESTLNVAELLFSKISDKKNNYQWELEQLAFQVFNQSFPLLINASHQQNCTIKKRQVTLANDETLFETRIAKLHYEQLTLDEIALQLGASVSTLQRYFKTKHQLTLKEYIRNQRLEQARRHLIFEDKTVGEASYLAGYNHVSNFVSAFKKYFSITPAALKNNYRN